MKYIRILLILGWVFMTQIIWSQSITNITVSGNCDMCKERIEKAALNVIGVESASWDVTTEELTVSYADGLFSIDEMYEAIAAVGHDTEKSLADDEIYHDLPACCKYTRVHNHEDAIEIGVRGVCGMCKNRIEDVALSFSQVRYASWDVDHQILEIKLHDEDFDIQKLHDRLAAIGHDTDRVKATDKAYENLHGCCKYRDTEVMEENGISADNPYKFRSTNDADLDSRFIDYVDSHDHQDSDEFIHGMVYEDLTLSKGQPLIGANVFWAGSSEGTTTDLDGFFEILPSSETTMLVISYVGYESDTIDMRGQELVAVSLNVNNVIDDVTITYKKKTTEVSFIDPMKVESIGQKELCKAACCSLSESFETNPSIDVSFTDAVTGTRKIEMLGLAGPNVQVMRENMPYIRGAASVYGFEYTSGQWIESIQLNTGAGSVVNGPESITGQINVELKKPENGEKLMVNLFANEAQRLELNLASALKVNEKVKTGILVNASSRQKAFDRNNDGFYDGPLGDQWIILNRWNIGDVNSDYRAQFGIKGTYLDRKSGQIGDLVESWKAPITTHRLEGWFKIGKVFKDAPYKSIGLQLSASNHDQDGLFGRRVFDADHRSLYANLIYNTIIMDTDKQVKMGISIISDQTTELIADDQYDRNEVMPGAFFEYHQNIGKKVSLVLGIRGDYHNNYGLGITPRLHFRYSPQENSAFRIAAGRGQRTASIFAENIGLFASNRRIVIEGVDEDHPYGLNQEIAYNIGASYSKEFIISKRSLVASIDYFYTFFDQQVVVDYDIDPREVHFYNLDGQSFSHSLQAQLDYELIDDVDIRVAYRYNDVKTDYVEGLRRKALTPEHRAFVNAGVGFGKGWLWDATLSWHGSTRLPDTDRSPERYRREEYSPDFFLMNTQISRTFSPGTRIYLGAENLFNYRQSDPIVSVDNTFNDYFDSSMIWGPVMGRNVYVGFTYTIQ